MESGEGREERGEGEWGELTPSPSPSPSSSLVSERKPKNMVDMWVFASVIS